MSVLETTLVFVVIPLGVAGVLALLTLSAGGNRTPRYRPGMPFEFTAVWFLAAPPPGAAGGDHAQLEAAPRSATTSSGPKGGARGTW